MKTVLFLALTLTSLSSFAKVTVSCVDETSFKRIDLSSKSCSKIKAELDWKLFKMRSASKTRAIIEDDKTITVVGNYFEINANLKEAIVYVDKHGPETTYHTNQSSLVVEYDSDGSVTAPFGGEIFLGERGESVALTCIDVKLALKRANCK